MHTWFPQNILGYFKVYFDAVSQSLAFIFSLDI